MVLRKLEKFCGRKSSNLGLEQTKIRPSPLHGSNQLERIFIGLWLNTADWWNKCNSLEIRRIVSSSKP